MLLNPYVAHSETGHVMDIFSLNLENRNIFLTGEITPELATSVISQLLYADAVTKENDASIRLYINSPGGSVSDGLAILDTMQNLKHPVETICTGMAASMAAVILAGGQKGKRKILPHSETMIHQPLSGMQGQATDLMIAADHVIKIREVINGILAEETGKSAEVINAATERDHWLSAIEAKNFGLVDIIITKEDLYHE